MTTTLYTINRREPRELGLCQALIREGDALLFVEDAVYALTVAFERELVQSLDKYRCFALRDDLVARGISDKIPPTVTQIGYPEFVALSLHYGRVVSW